MENLSDLPDVLGTLTTLNDQIRDCRQKLMSARKEATSLREENLLLTDRLERKDERVKEIKKERDELGREVERQRLELWRRSLGGQASLTEKENSDVLGTPEQKQVDTIRRPRKVSPGGFTVLPKDHRDYRDIFDGSTYLANGAALRHLAATWKPSRASVVLLSNRQWELTEVPATGSDAASAAAELVDTHSSHAIDERAEDDDDQPGNLQLYQDVCPSARKPIPNRTRVDRERDHGAGSPKEGGRIGGHDEIGDRQSAPPRAYFKPSDPRRDSLEHTIFGRYARDAKRRLPDDFLISKYGDDYRRKSVCVHCWLTSGYCDSYARCGRCQIDKVKCVRKLCNLGLSCRNPRCPCLHPGQWDEKDTEWNVEEGPLPMKMRHSLPNALGDHYRPGRDAEDGAA